MTSAAFVCLTVLLLDKAYGFGSREPPAPQATLMKLVIEGVLDAKLPWVLVGIGVETLGWTGAAAAAVPQVGAIFVFIVLAAMFVRCCQKP